MKSVPDVQLRQQNKNNILIENQQDPTYHEEAHQLK